MVIINMDFKVIFRTFVE